jgi:GNAT superfamily N-acetyltransferase
MSSSIQLNVPDVGELGEIVNAMCEWQSDGLPVQLHPGDLGWNWQFGPEAVAAGLRTWVRDGTVLAVGLLDSPQLIRMAIANGSEDDAALANKIFDDLTHPDRGVLPRGEVRVEARFGELLRSLILDKGWVPDELWTPLQRDLSAPVEDCGLRVEVVGPALADVRVALQRAAFATSTFSRERWNTMAAGVPYESAKCLLAYDEDGTAVALATVWSAGPGRPGLLEPVGVHHDHRGRGYGTAISVAAAAALRTMGSSYATVCTTSANVAAVATYESAGFRALPQVPDLRRIAWTVVGLENPVPGAVPFP